MILWGFEQVDGWHFSQKWNYYQRTEGRAVAYIQRYIGFYCLQVYERGLLGVCDIEYRTEDFQEAVDKALEFLDKYKDKDSSEMAKDYWSPHNKQGYWQVDYKGDRE